MYCPLCSLPSSIYSARRKPLATDPPVGDLAAGRRPAGRGRDARARKWLSSVSFCDGTFSFLGLVVHSGDAGIGPLPVCGGEGGGYLSGVSGKAKITRLELGRILEVF